MSEHLKPLLYNCIVCGQKGTGLLSCDNPEHKEIAAGKMDSNAGIPTESDTVLTEDDFCEVFDWVMDHSSMAANHLPESPLGMDVDVRQCHK